MNATAPAAGSPNPSGSGAQLIDSLNLALLLSVPVETLSKWRQKKIGPPYIRLPNGRVRYDWSAVIDWLAGRSYIS